MARRKRLCELYRQGESSHGNDLDMGGYLAAVECDALPRAVRTDNRVVRRGYGIGFGQWFFFDTIEPAVAFGRSARMSLNCSGYGVYEAAHELALCDIHRTDERVLLVGRDVLDQWDGEVETLKRFVQGVKEHLWSSHWRPLTGYVTDYNRGRPITPAGPRCRCSAAPYAVSRIFRSFCRALRACARSPRAGIFSVFSPPYARARARRAGRCRTAAWRARRAEREAVTDPATVTAACTATGRHAAPRVDL